MGDNSKKICSICKKTKDAKSFHKMKSSKDGHRPDCKECRKNESKKNYQKTREKLSEARKNLRQTPRYKEMFLQYQRDYRERNRGKNKARGMVSKAVHRGKIEKLPCVVCGNENAEAHHHDYSKPLDVMWLCRKHHLAIHGKEVINGRSHMEGR